MKKYSFNSRRRRSPRHSPRRKHIPKQSKSIGFDQKISKGPNKGNGFKWSKPQSRSKSPLFVQKPRSKTPIYFNESIIPKKSITLSNFSPLQNTRQCRSESPTPYYRRCSPYYKYIPNKNIVISYDKEDKQYIGILLNTNIYNYPNNMYWINIMEKQYGCINIKSNFNYDGFSVFQVLNLQNFNSDCPFCIKWIKTDIYTSRSFYIKKINQNGIVGEQYFFDENKYQYRYNNPGYCNYIFKCKSCGVFFKTDEKCDECRWCSA